MTIVSALGHLTWLFVALAVMHFCPFNPEDSPQSNWLSNLGLAAILVLLFPLGYVAVVCSELQLPLVTIDRLGTDAFSSRKWDVTALGDSRSNHDMPMKLSLSRCPTCERLPSILQARHVGQVRISLGG